MDGLKENHGLTNPCGLAGRVAAGAGVGWKIPTRQQPSPAVRVGPARCGLFFFASGWAWATFFRHRSGPSIVRLLHCHHPRSCKTPLPAARPRCPFFCGSASVKISARRRSEQTCHFQQSMKFSINNQRSLSRCVVFSDSRHAF
jgi:hypothetical protein